MPLPVTAKKSDVRIWWTPRSLPGYHVTEVKTARFAALGLRR